MWSVVVSSRLVTFDRSLEEAALGSWVFRPFDAFRLVTLPSFAGGYFRDGLLAFTLSLD